MILSLLTPTLLAATVTVCLAAIALAVRSLRRDAVEDARVTRHLEAIRLSAYTWDAPTGWTGLSERTDTASFPAIVLAGTVTR